MDFKKLLQETQKIQNSLNKKTQEFNEKNFEFDYKGYVKTKINGKLEILSVELNKDLVDPEDKETLEDIIKAAINEAVSKVSAEKDAITNSVMPKGMGGLF